MTDELNQKWGALLNSGSFRKKGLNIWGGFRFKLNHSASSEYLTLNVSALDDNQDKLPQAIGYIAEVLDLLDSFPETHFITGREEPSREELRTEEKIAKFASFTDDPYAAINNMTANSHCTISEDVPVQDGSATLKIKLNAKSPADITKLAQSLDSAAYASERRFLVSQFKVQEDDINTRNAQLLDDIHEKKVQKTSLGKETDQYIVYTFLQNRLKEHAIYNPSIEFGDFRDDDNTDPDLTSEDYLKKQVLNHIDYTNQADQLEHTIRFPVPSADFIDDYKSLHQGLKNVFTAVQPVRPTPVNVFNPDKYLIGKNFEMRVHGSFARLAADIRKNAPEEYQSIINQAQNNPQKPSGPGF